MTEQAQDELISPMENTAQVASSDQNIVREEPPVPAESTQNIAPEPAVAEKMIPQSQVNEIVRAKIAKERARASAAVNPHLQQQPIEQSIQESPVDISQKVATEVDKRLQALHREQKQEVAVAEANKTLDSLNSKIEEASKKYPDFEEVTKDIPYASFPGLLTAANSVDNSGDVLYHLGKNPSKMRELASSFQPVMDPSTGQQVENPMVHVAMKELRQLSDSIHNNEIAQQKNLPKEPLGQIRPSNVSSDNGEPSVTELRKRWTV